MILFCCKLSDSALYVFHGEILNGLKRYGADTKPIQKYYTKNTKKYKSVKTESRIWFRFSDTVCFHILSSGIFLFSDFLFELLLLLWFLSRDFLPTLILQIFLSSMHNNSFSVEIAVGESSLLA